MAGGFGSAGGRRFLPGGFEGPVVLEGPVLGGVPQGGSGWGREELGRWTRGVGA